MSSLESSICHGQLRNSYSINICRLSGFDLDSATNFPHTWIQQMPTDLSPYTRASRIIIPVLSVSMQFSFVACTNTTSYPL
jgi:hypothetical protein